jgi:hypothetical protein
MVSKKSKSEGSDFLMLTFMLCAVFKTQIYYLKQTKIFFPSFFQVLVNKNSDE